jgi:hypothetical protein
MNVIARRPTALSSNHFVLAALADVVQAEARRASASGPTELGALTGFSCSEPGSRGGAYGGRVAGGLATTFGRVPEELADSVGRSGQA